MRRFASRLLVFVFVALTVLLAGCGGEASERSAPQTKQMAQGRQVYQRQCLTCHQANGEGISGVYPTLHQTRWSEGDRGRLIRLVLHGMEGPVDIKGESYDQLMQPHSYLTDEEIAAVLTFVRQNFGNDAPAVSAGDVAAVRATSSQDGTWTPDLLWEETGIPRAAN